MVNVNLSRAVQDGLSTALQAREKADAASNRLATGQKISTALEDPTAYFSSLSLKDNAARLNRILEHMSQGIQVAQAADKGLKSLDKMVSSAKAVLDQASRADDLFARAQFAADYNNLLDQMAGIARDSGYGDRNLLAGEGNDVRLYLNPDSSYATEMKAVDFTDITRDLGLAKAVVGEVAQTTIKLADSGGSPLTLDRLLTSESAFTVGDSLTLKDGNGVVLASFTVTSSTKVADLVNAFSKPALGFQMTLGEDGNLALRAVGVFSLEGGTTGGAFESLTFQGSESGWATAGPLEAAKAEIETARLVVRKQSETISSDLAFLQKRQDFMKSFSGILLSGAEETMAADINEESANLLALQLRQQLSVTALSFAREADQSILRMLG